jgi:hypothetical protein
MVFLVILAGASVLQQIGGFGSIGATLCVLFLIALFGVPLFSIVYSLVAIAMFLRNPQIAKRRQLPDRIEIDPDEQPLNETAGPRRKKERIVNRSTWYHTRWIGPGEYNL